MYICMQKRRERQRGLDLSTVSKVCFCVNVSSYATTWEIIATLNNVLSSHNAFQYKASYVEARSKL